MVRGRASAISLVIAQAEPVLETLYVQCAASEYSDLNLHRIGDVIRVEQVPENRRCQEWPPPVPVPGIVCPLVTSLGSEAGPGGRC